jgi:hypothetical protein
LIAETTEGVFYGAESVSNPQFSDKGPSVPEDLGLLTAKLLLEEIFRVIQEVYLIKYIYFLY